MASSFLKRQGGPATQNLSDAKFDGDTHTHTHIHPSMKSITSIMRLLRRAGQENALREEG